MKKINLIIHPDDRTVFHELFLQPIWSEHFNILEYNENTIYSIADSLIVTKSTNCSFFWYKKLLDAGAKVLIEQLWESSTNIEIKNSLVLSNINWFWYNESFWYKDLGYNNYLINKTYKKLALMPMRLLKPHRTELLNRLTFCLDDLIYSYIDQNIFLPNDDDNKSSGIYQRYVNFNWYNDTYFSIVAESEVKHTPIFITEKTFKPIAFSHPMLVYGSAGTLNHLKSIGFETFDNLFDESYDSIADSNSRLDKIIDNVKNFKKCDYDKLTVEKLSHNRDLFFNSTIIEQRIENEIITPILEYAATP